MNDDTANRLAILYVYALPGTAAFIAIPALLVKSIFFRRTHHGGYSRSRLVQ